MSEMKESFEIMCELMEIPILRYILLTLCALWVLLSVATIFFFIKEKVKMHRINKLTKK